MCCKQNELQSIMVMGEKKIHSAEMKGPKCVAHVGRKMIEILFLDIGRDAS